ncbi:MAG: ribonuclease HII, partial [Verrucomicrobiota bacterium]
IAKVTRDRLMVQMDEVHPGYEFSRHKGYGTALHLERLRKHGPCPIHRRTFLPVQQALFPFAES